MECKVISGTLKKNALFWINRNIMECKDLGNKIAAPLVKGLIETLWNVKIVDYTFKTKPFPGLIETLWNVKTFTISIF